jgi:hypothetical protein
MHGHTKHALFVCAQRPSQHSVSGSQSPLFLQAHEPLLQSTPFAQAALQAPQCCRSLSDCSQPSAGFPLQSAKPASHAPSLHVPLAQSPDAWGGAHGRLQAPQFNAVCSDASQPSAGLPLQSCVFTAQLSSRQVPLTHLALLAFINIVQLLPHAPQLRSLVKSASQPSAARPLQSACPGPHTRLHTPVAQLDETVSISPVHGLLQLPQCAGRLKSASQPSVHVLLQLPRPSLHRVIWHSPSLLHCVVALEAMQAFSQSPQSLLVRTSISHPLLGSPSQSFHPASQAPIPHRPSWQAALACGLFGQR